MAGLARGELDRVRRRRRRACATAAAMSSIPVRNAPSLKKPWSTATSKQRPSAANRRLSLGSMAASFADRLRSSPHDSSRTPDPSGRRGRRGRAGRARERRDDRGADRGRPQLHGSGAAGRRGLRAEGRRRAGAGSVTARLDGGAGDWDLAVFDALTGRLVAGSSYRGSRELASGYAPRRDARRCRRAASPAAPAPRTLTVDHPRPSPVGRRAAPSMVRVATPTRRGRSSSRTSASTSPSTAAPGFLEVVLHGAADAQKLRDAGFQYVTCRPHGPGPPGPPRRRRLRRRHRRVRAAQRPDHLPAAVRLQRGHEAARARAPRPRQADHAQPHDLRGPPGRGHRDHHEPERPRRQARVPPDGRPPRARVAVGRARDGVGVRAGPRLPARRRARPAARRDHAHDRRAGRQPRRLQRLARGRRAAGRRRRARRQRRRRDGQHPHAPERVPAQELPPDHRRRSPATASSRRSASPARASTRTATTAASGAARARPATRPTRPTAAPARSRSPRPRTSASWSPRARSRR